MNINLIIAPISFSQGKAGCMRLQYLVNELRKNDELRITNLVIHNIENEIDKQYYNDNVSCVKLINHKHFGFLLNIFKIIKLLNTKKEAKNILYYYDINYNPIDFFFFIIVKLMGYKIIFDEIELYKTKIFEVKRGKLFKILLVSFNQYMVKFFASHIFCISSDIKNYFPKNSSILPISFDMKLLDLNKSNYKKQEILISYSGSFAEKDNISLLLNVVKKIKLSGLEFKLYLIGSCDVIVLKKIHKIIKEYNLNSTVIITGFLTIDKYRELLLNSSIFIVPRNNSKFSNAGFPFKLGEYLALEKAVIVSNTGDVSKYLTNDDAFIIAPESELELESAMLKLITDETLRNKLSVNGKLKALKYFNPINHSEKIINTLYDI